MKEITLEELYEVITDTGLMVTGNNNRFSEHWTKEAVTQVLTDLKKLGYKIVKE